jgi:hypothetical protein
MPLPSEIQLVALDYDTIRAELKRFLQNQTEFTDYNFEGSTLSLLLDVLSYDAYFHSWYTNFAVNESFLQTSQIRNSVVAAARQVGYVPRSTMGSLAVVDLTVGSVNTAEGTITVSKHTPFTTTLSGNTYTFYTIDDYTTSVNGSSNVVITGVELYEGTKLTQTSTIATVTNTGSVVTLLNQNVDTRTITVSVGTSAQINTAFVYTKATSSVLVNASSNVYFLFETNNGTYDLQFGDGRLGRKLAVGQQVVVTYLDSRGIEGNGANTFVYAGNSLGVLSQTSNVSIVLNNINLPSYGAGARESIDSIKHNAPSIYKTQGRIVTASDARAVILAEVGGIDSVSVWGGEYNDPVTYGKLFVALKPSNVEKFGPTQKANILANILKPKSLPILGYEFVDPDYIYVVVDSLVRYSSNFTAYEPETLRQLVVSGISLYASDTLGQFGSYFRYSSLSGVIDAVDNSIQSNLTSVRLEKHLVTNAAISSYTLTYANPIYQPDSSANVVSVTSKIGIQSFSHTDEAGLVRKDCFIENSGNTINFYRAVAGDVRLLTKSSVGTANFETGVISLTNFKPTGITTNKIGELRVRVIPRDSDIIPNRSQIILIPADSITVTMVEDLTNRSRTTFGRVSAGNQLGSGSFS